MGEHRGMHTRVCTHTHSKYYPKKGVNRHTLCRGHTESYLGSAGPEAVTNKSVHPRYLYPNLAHSNHFAAL